MCSPMTGPSAFTHQLHDVTRLLRKHFDRRAAAFGLTRAQWRLLKAIHRQEGQTQAALADTLEMEPVAVGRVIDRLAQGGFIERRADPADRRCWRLHLTAKAHAVADDMEVIAQKLRDDSVKGIEPAHLKIFLQVLSDLRSNLDVLDTTPTTDD